MSARHGGWSMKPKQSWRAEQMTETVASDGSTASYYELPEGATELQHLISYKNMNGQVAEAFRSLYRFGESSHSSRIRDAKKVIFYMQAEIERIKKYEESDND
jgi:hypothetical protein